MFFFRYIEVKLHLRRVLIAGKGWTQKWVLVKNGGGCNKGIVQITQVYLLSKQNIHWIFTLSSQVLFIVVRERNIMKLYVPGSINSHYFHIIGDKLINPIVGVYIPIIGFPIKGGIFPIPKKTRGVPWPWNHIICAWDQLTLDFRCFVWRLGFINDPHL